MNKPRVICHMASTIDGRTIVDNWGDSYKKFSGLFEQCHNSFNSQAWMVGRVTMEKDFTEGRKPDLPKPGKTFPRTPHVADKEAKSFAIAVDSKGKLGWDENEIDGDHIIELLNESVSDQYLQYLQDKNISYIFAGKDSIDFAYALSQLYDVFGIKTLMLEGGGHINGSLLHARLIDEVSILVMPFADGTPNTPTSFEVAAGLPKKAIQELELADVKTLDHGVVWLKYTAR